LETKNDFFFKLNGFFLRAKKLFKGEHFFKGLRWVIVRSLTYIMQETIYTQCFLIYQKIRHKPIIRVIGDSHAHVFRGKWPFVVYWIGPATAYNLNNPVSKTFPVQKISAVLKKFRKNEHILLTFGEIDCRNHIYKQYLKNEDKVSLDQVISSVIHNYGEVIKSMRQSGFNTAVLSVAPAASVVINTDVDYPSVGSPEERSVVTRTFNKQLEEFCLANDCMYIDVYTKTCDKNGWILREYAYDTAHLNKRIIPFVLEQYRNKYHIKL
jgi:hypothetical protein